MYKDGRFSHFHSGSQLHSSSKTHLIIHDDLISHSVKKCRFCEQFLLFILGLLFIGFLYVIRRQHVESSHLICFEAPVVDVSVHSGRLEDLEEVIDLP